MRPQADEGCSSRERKYRLTVKDSRQNPESSTRNFALTAKVGSHFTSLAARALDKMRGRPQQRTQGSACRCGWLSPQPLMIGSGITMHGWAQRSLITPSHCRSRRGLVLWGRCGAGGPHGAVPITSRFDGQSSCRDHAQRRRFTRLRPSIWDHRVALLLVAAIGVVVQLKDATKHHLGGRGAQKCRLVVVPSSLPRPSQASWVSASCSPSLSS